MCIPYLCVMSHMPNMISEVYLVWQSIDLTDCDVMIKVNEISLSPVKHNVLQLDLFSLYIYNKITVWFLVSSHNYEICILKSLVKHCEFWLDFIFIVWQCDKWYHLVNEGILWSKLLTRHLWPTLLLYFFNHAYFVHFISVFLYLQYKDVDGL